MSVSKNVNVAIASALLASLLGASVTTAVAQAPDADGPPNNGPLGVLSIRPAPANVAPPSAEPRNLEGVYAGEQPNLSARPPGMGKMPQYTGEAMVRVKRRMELRQKKLEEPSPAFFCRPYTHVLNIPQPVFPAKVVQTKDRVVFLTEEGRSVWEIFLDRGHPKNLVPTYNGHSIGRWEGDTLVVDVVGFNGKAWLDMMAGPNSTNAHMTVWIKKINGGKQLEISHQVEDPAVYIAKPEVRTSKLDWHPELRLGEFNCEESVGIGTFPSQRGAGYSDRDYSKIETSR